MKLANLLTAQASLALVSSTPLTASRDDGYPAEMPEWHPGGPNDFRGPCPMMNTLANHGFLPRDGRNITKENAVIALTNGLNFNESLAELMWEQAIIANPEPNATFFTLDHLNRHNVLEHDASLSRTDAYFGNNHVYNATVFATSRKYFARPVLTPTDFANAKVFRQVESRAFNPNYTFTAATEPFSLGEMAAPIIAFGDMETGEVDRELVEYFFENERLPTELGWSKKTEVIGIIDIMQVSNMVGAATNLLTGGGNATAPDSPHGNEQRRDLHMVFVS